MFPNVPQAMPSHASHNLAPHNPLGSDNSMINMDRSSIKPGEDGRAIVFERKTWRLAHGRSLEVGPRGVLMGILNVTPDSFSDGGRFKDDPNAAVDAALRMVEEGASIIDVGGESTRPGAASVDAAEEQRRALPVIERLVARSNCVVSVDTYRAETARLAVSAGAHIVNDVWGAQKDGGIAAVAAETGAGLCLLHTGRERDTLPDVVADQVLFLRRSLELARNAGVPEDSIVLDPGFGFGKDGAQNLELIRRFDELGAFRFPLLVGTSRKRFLRGIIGRNEADIATAATTALLRVKGAAIFRVHDVAANRDALAVADAALGSA